MTLENIKSYLKRINPRSPIFIAAVFSAFFIFLILFIVQVRVQNEEQNNTSQVQPSAVPTQKLVRGRDFVEGQINVKFIDGFTDQKIDQLLTKYNARIKSTITGINVKVVEVPVGKEEEITKQLTQDGIVKYAEVDAIGHAQFAPNDTNFANQWGLSNTGQSIKGQSGIVNDDVQAKTAWDVTKGAGIKVAILDTGIDLDHPDMSGKIAANKSFTTATVDDKFGHGTHVAGTVTANTNNSSGIAGTCPECQLLIVKVMDDSGSGQSSDFASGMTWAADNGAKVINASIVYNQNIQTIADSVAYAWGKNVVIVAAAGNCGDSNYGSNNCSFQNQTLYPAAYPNVISVAALDNKDQKTSFSNSGSSVDVAAPGNNIYSTLPTHSYALQNYHPLSLTYDYLSGTSMASPMVAGIAALVWSSQYGTSNQAVVDRIFNTAVSISGTGTLWQKGRVNAAAAVGASANSTPTPPGPTGGPTVTPGSITIVPSPSSVVPTFVCGGSQNSICNPTSTVAPRPTATVAPGITALPTLTPRTTPVPENDCLNPRSTPEKIQDWYKGFLKKINDYIQAIMGNPQNPRPTPPQPCVIR